MSALIERYWTHYGMKKRSANREKSVLDGIRTELGKAFVQEVDGDAVRGSYLNRSARKRPRVNECSRIVRALIFECFWLAVSC